VQQHDERVSEAGGSEPRLLRVETAARGWSVSGRTVRAKIAEKKIAAIRIGRSIRIPRAEFERICREGL
jgi:excisionase family DNA binding protein